MYHGSTKLNLTTGQKNSLKSLMKNTTTDKRHYRRLMAILQQKSNGRKSNGRTFEDTAKEHDVSASGQSRDGYQHISILELVDWK